MADWNPDESFLDFVIIKLRVEGGDLLGAFQGLSDKVLTPNDLVNDMRNGTVMGQKLYATLFELYPREFNEYLVSRR